jgi:hypothetical protein
MATAQKVDTAHVAQRKVLHFKSLDEVQAEVDRLAAADRDGRLRMLGNWTFGQNLGHLASWVNYSFDGVPMKVPFIVRLIMRPMKKIALYKAMRAGSKIPRVPGGTLGKDVFSSEEGVTRITAAFKRLKAGPPAIPHLLFGPLTHDEWINQHLRHAELHLSFCQTD